MKWTILALAMTLGAALMPLAVAQSPEMDDEALTRELGYNFQRLTIDERARLESQRLLTIVAEATLAAYEKAISEGASEEVARAEVEELVSVDLAKLDPNMANEIQAVVTAVLDGREIPTNVSPLFQNRVIEASELRQAQLSQTSPANLTAGLQRMDAVVGVGSGTGLNASTRGVRRYQTRQELIAAMVSGDESERWVATANMSVKSSRATGHDETFTAQLSVEFLGSQISAGPIFTFKRRLTTSVDVKGEGMYPLFNEQGIFDLIWKGADGRPLTNSNGTHQRRFVFFTCDAELLIESERALRGGFKISGVGAEGNLVHTYQNTITLSSRRLLVPDSVDGRQVNLAFLAQICHNDFMRARTQNGRSVRDNMNTTARNLASGLTFVDRASECMVDTHCNNWFRGVVSIHKYRTAPRCARAVGNNAMFSCQLRGQVGANCQVVRNGRRVSSGYFEYTCDRGLRCVVTREGNANFFTREPWVGECRR